MTDADNSIHELINNVAMRVDPAQIANKQVAVIKRSMLASMVEQAAEVRAAAGRAVGEIKEEYEKKLESLREEYESKLAGLREKSSAEIEELEARLAEAEARAQSAADELSAVKDALERLDTERNKLQADYNNLLERYHKVGRAAETIALLEERLADAESRTEMAERKVLEYDEIMRADGRKAVADLAKKFTDTNQQLFKHQLESDIFDAVAPFDFDGFHEQLETVAKDMKSWMSKLEETGGIPQSIRAPLKEIIVFFKELETHAAEAESSYRTFMEKMFDGEGSIECVMQLLLASHALENLQRQLALVKRALELAAPAV